MSLRNEIIALAEPKFVVDSFAMDGLQAISKVELEPVAVW